MNKKGFTLVELIIVIALLGLLIIITIPTYQGIMNNIKQKNYDSKVLLIENAAYNYGEKNKTDIMQTAKCLTLDDLIGLNYLTSDKNNEYIITNPKTGDELKGVVQIYYDFNNKKITSKFISRDNKVCNSEIGDNGDIVYDNRYPTCNFSLEVDGKIISTDISDDKIWIKSAGSNLTTKLNFASFMVPDYGIYNSEQIEIINYNKEYSKIDTAEFKEKKLYGYVKNTYGNVGMCSITYGWDYTKPTITILKQGTTYVFSASDDNSMQYKFGENGTYGPYESIQIPSDISKIYVKDEAGNESFVSVEKIAPIITLNGNLNYNPINRASTLIIPLKITEENLIIPNEFTADDIKVLVDGTIQTVNKTLVYNTVQNGEYKYTLTLSNISGNGNLTLQIPESAIKDAIGNSNILTTLDPNVTVDNVAPTGNSILINNGAEYTNSTSVNLTLESIGATQMCLTETNSSSGCTWVTYATTKTYTISLGDGTKTIYAFYKDTVGNISDFETDTITLDQTKPTCNIVSASVNGDSNATKLKLTDEATIVFTCSNMTDLTENDIYTNIDGFISNKNLTPENNRYILSFKLSSQPNINSNLTLTIPAGIVEDDAGNQNEETEIDTQIKLIRTFDVTCSLSNNQINPPNAYETENYIGTFSSAPSNNSIIVKMNGVKLSVCTTNNCQSAKCYLLNQTTLKVCNVNGDISIEKEKDPTCLIEGTKILLGNGKYKNIEDIYYDDLLLTYNYETGKFVSEYPIWIEKEKSTTTYQLTKFSDGSILKTRGYHGIFDIDNNEFISVDDKEKFKVGTNVAKINATKNGFDKAKVTKIEYVNEPANYYHVVSTRYYNIIANDFLTTDGTVILSNLFGFDKNITWTDLRTKAIKNKNLYSYNEFKNILPYYLFEGLRVGDGKVLNNYGFTKEMLIEYLNQNVLEESMMLPTIKNKNNQRLWMVTTSEDIVTEQNKSSFLVKEGTNYILSMSKKLTNKRFMGWYNSSDNKIYQPGDIVNIYIGTHFEAIYEN